MVRMRLSLRGHRLRAIALAAGLAVAPALAQPAPLDLPLPPAPGTPADAADRAAVAAAYPADRIALADRDRLLDPFAAFVGVIGPGFDAGTLPATARLLSEVLAAAASAAVEAKARAPRLRPFVMDPSVARCPGAALLEPDRSWPSGHAAVGAAWAVVLAALLPGRSEALMARGLDYGTSRVVCGVHWPSDVIAGQTLGAAVGAAVVADPRFAPLLTAAGAELIQVAGP